jgi:type IV secretory pathway VirB2 component (pilin)
MNNSIDQAANRARRYWYVDGLNEGAFGGLCLLLGIYFQIQENLLIPSLIRHMLEAGLVLFIVAIVLLLNKLVNLLKERITYPRSGYVSYRRPNTIRRIITGLLAAAIASVLSAVLMIAPPGLDWMAGLTGLALAAVWLFLAWRFQLSRFLVLSLVSLGGGIFLALMQPDGVTGIAVMYFLEGTALLVSGGITFWAYLRATQPIEEKEF